MSVQISRDPFARSTTERELVRGKGCCDWCGQERPRLFRYGTWPDGLFTRTLWHKGLFCSKPCHDDYHRT